MSDPHGHASRPGCQRRAVGVTEEKSRTKRKRVLSSDRCLGATHTVPALAAAPACPAIRAAESVVGLTGYSSELRGRGRVGV
jgi:hypothetical protein